MLVILMLLCRTEKRAGETLESRQRNGERRRKDRQGHWYHRVVPAINELACLNMKKRWLQFDNRTKILIRLAPLGFLSNEVMGCAIGCGWEMRVKYKSECFGSTWPLQKICSCVWRGILEIHNATHASDLYWILICWAVVEKIWTFRAKRNVISTRYPAQVTIRARIVVL